MITAGLNVEIAPKRRALGPTQSLGDALHTGLSVVDMVEAPESLGAERNLRDKSRRSSVSKGFTTTFVGVVLASSTLFTTPSAASDWGCEVLLCLSNPGGPMQFAACVPPITRLYDVLRSGGSFPTCTGVGFSSSVPGVEPYRCEDGSVLTRIDGAGGDNLTCRTRTRELVDLDKCMGPDASETAEKRIRDGKGVCVDYKYSRPEKREQPYYVDVTIEGRTQRIWF